MDVRTLIAFEESGEVRDAFIRAGHAAISCDLLPSAKPGPHIQGDIVDVMLSEKWRRIIAFPPCTDLCVSGARWFPEKWADGRQQAAIRLFMLTTTFTCPWAIENPVGIMSTAFRKPDQIIQPWQFGHGETKATCLWLNGLPPLKPTDIVTGREPRVHRMAPGPDRAKMRSRTYPGIAQAMAEQWGKL